MNNDGSRAAELDELLCFDLYAASRAVTAAYRPLLQEFHLTYPQYVLLVVLWRRRTCPIKDLARALHLDHATLTPMIRRMEAAGLISCETAPQDRRTVLVSVTQAGARMERHFDALQCRVNQMLGIEPDRAKKLQQVLRTIEARATAESASI